MGRGENKNSSFPSWLPEVGKGSVTCVDTEG